jgi:hypothetical protein
MCTRKTDNFIRRHYKCSLPLLFLVLSSVACGWEYHPSPRTTIEPIPVEIEQLLIQTKDLPQIDKSWYWRSDIFDESDRWEYAAPVDAITGFHEDSYVGRYEVHQLLLRFQDANEAYRFWEYHKESLVVDGMSEYTTERKLMLSMAELPHIHAERVYLVCDNYWTENQPDCAARLQYRMFFVELKSVIGSRNLTPEQFYTLIGHVDHAMRPIWERWPVPTPVSPLPTPTQTTVITEPTNIITSSVSGISVTTQ